MQGGSASSGKHERRRIDGDHRRRSRTKTMAWRRCRASRGAWLGGEEEGVEAELLSSAEGRGVAGGYGCDGGALRWLSVVLQIEGGRELERAERRDSGRGGRGHLRGVAGDVQGEEEAARQGGGGRGAWPRAPGACPSSWQRRKATGEGGGLGRPDGAGPGKWRQVSGPGGLLSFIFVLFSIFCSLF